MKISRLTYRNFRNLETIDFSPSPAFNILWGNNAQGKTNLLEGIYLLGNLKSFRGARNPEMVPATASAAYLKAEIVEKSVHHRLELAIEPHAKKVRLDGKEVRSARDFFGHLRPILFSPDELNVVKGPPQGRRGFLDRSLFQADPRHLERVQEYARCLKQRNSLLKERASDDVILPWTENLIKSGARLQWKRVSFIQTLVPRLRTCYQAISGNGEIADLRYPCSAQTEAECEDILRGDLKKLAAKEKILGTTLIGPHRDDPKFMLNGHSLRLYGSQGQQRSYVLSYKMAQIFDLEERLGEPPVLLLDDMTSELDRQRKNFLVQFLLSRSGQVFLTTTDRNLFHLNDLEKTLFLRVENGKLSEDEK